MSDDSSTDPNDEVRAARPSLRGTRIVEVSSDEVILQRGLAEVRLQYADALNTVTRLQGLADGTRTYDQIVGAFQSEEQPQIHTLMGRLAGRRIAHHLVGDPSPADNFWVSIEAISPQANTRVGTSSVYVIGSDHVAVATAAALQACGVGHVERGESAPATDWDVWCLVGADPAWEEFVDVARQAIVAGVVCLPLWLEDFVAHIGPLTHPFDSACLQCYLLRVDSNDELRETHRRLRRLGREPFGSAGSLPPMVQVAAQIGAMEIVKHLAGLPASVVGRAIELSLVPFRSDVRRVLRVPRCPVCSPASHQGGPVAMLGSQLAE